MYKKLRQDTILEILKKQGYVTVDYLTRQLHYSTATINRDLNLLEKQQLIKRSYGGAELIKNKVFLYRFGMIKCVWKSEKSAVLQQNLLRKAILFLLTATPLLKVWNST